MDAIRFRTKTDLAKLRSRSVRENLLQDVSYAEAAERELLRAFGAFLVEGPGTAEIRLTREEKLRNVGPFLPAIALLFALRNRSNPRELEKLAFLHTESDLPDHALFIDFDRKESGNGRFFIRRIRIEAPIPPAEIPVEPEASEPEKPSRRRGKIPA